jgi:hypothetical protein
MKFFNDDLSGVPIRMMLRKGKNPCADGKR